MGGYIRTAEHRRKASERVKRWRAENPEHTEKLRAISIGHEVTPDMRAKLRSAQLGRKHSQATKDICSQKSKEYGAQLEVRIRRSRRMRGTKNIKWSGGCHIRPSGYVVITTRYGKRELEHRLVMEQHLGRPLTPEEVVHHRKKVKDDNRLDQLQLFPSNREHTKHHRNQEKELRGKEKELTPCGV